MPTFPNPSAALDFVRVGLWGRLPMAAKGLGTLRAARTTCGDLAGGLWAVTSG
jgi:hypothetical protein